MVIVPAAALGALVVWCVGYIVTYALLDYTAKRKITVKTFCQGVWRDQKWLDVARRNCTEAITMRSPASRSLLEQNCPIH
jgi:hypothetical protein